MQKPIEFYLLAIKFHNCHQANHEHAGQQIETLNTANNKLTIGFDRDKFWSINSPTKTANTQEAKIRITLQQKLMDKQQEKLLSNVFRGESHSTF